MLAFAESQASSDFIWWKWLIADVGVPLTVSLVPALLAWYLAKYKFKKTELPIAQNPVVSLKGRWEVTYWATNAFDAERRVDGGEEDILRDVPGDRSPEHLKASIYVNEDGPAFTALALSKKRTWNSEGYIDGDSILYVYKDKSEPNSFGSAFIKSVGQNTFEGSWTGLSPDFKKEDGTDDPDAFIVHGRVRWRKLQ